MAWPVQEAKQRFSRFVNAANTEGPQVVTRHGREVAVLLSLADYQTLSGRSVKDALREFGEAAEGDFEELLAEIVASRKTDRMREIDLEP